MHQGLLFRAGIISDIQYADIPDGKSFGGIPRYYRSALQGLRRAVVAWREQEVDCAIHFGDVLDGFHPKAESLSALKTIVAEFDLVAKPHYHMIGNHCLYNLPRQVLNEELRMGTATSASYYQWSPHKRWRMVVLDGYDISMLGWPEGHPNHAAAVETLDCNNPNQEKNMPPGEGLGRRFVKFGGAVSEAQLAWLRSNLHEAAQQGQRVLVLSHLPLHPATVQPACLMWNFQEVLDVLHAAEEGTVAATIAGHAHQNGYVQDEHGLHHVVLNAVVETVPDGDCYGWLDLFEHELSITGVGQLASRHLHLNQSS